MNYQCFDTFLFHSFIHCICAHFSLLSLSLYACRDMVSRLQPQASSMEDVSNGKIYQNLMSISAKQNFNSDYHYMLFDWFLNFSL